MKPSSKNSPSIPAKVSSKDGAPDRQTRDTDPMPETVPQMVAHPDTVKLTAQTWQPPPSSMDTVKLTHQTWEPPPSGMDTVKPTAQTPSSFLESLEDDETDIQEVRTGRTNIASSSVASNSIIGTGHAEVAGEIGSSDEIPVRIVSAPPSTLSSPVKLPGMPAPVISKQQTDKSSSVPMPSPSPPPSDPRTDVAPSPVPQMADAGMANNSPMMVPPQQQHQNLQMGPAAGPLSPQRSPPFELPPQHRVDPTMVLRINRGPGRAIAITAVTASLIGLAVGYMLWGFPTDGQHDTSAESASTSKGQQPAVTSVPLCQVAVTSEPDNANVRANGKLLGHTPIDIEIPCDTKSLTLLKRAFVRQSMPLSLSTSNAQATHGILKRKQFKISVKSNPKGATVLREDQEIGKTPLKIILPGYIETTLVIRHKGYLDRKARLVPKKALTVNYRLKRNRKKR